jgi:Zn-dependent protease
MGSLPFAQNIQLLSIQMVPFIMAVVFHEVAHGWVANKWGDTTAKDAGRLTLNPIPHLDPIGTVLFPMINMLFGFNALIGWAKPVPIDPRRFKKYRPGLFWVSFAGPGMNVLLAVLSAAVLCAIARFVPRDFYLFEPLLQMANVSILLNFWLAAFNMIPLPPLDGSKIVESFLSYEATRKYESISQYSFLILMGLLLSGALGFLSGPIFAAKTFTLNTMATLFGIAT